MRANCAAKVAKVASYFRHAGSISLERGGAERPLRGDRAMCPSCRRHLSAERGGAERPLQGDRLAPVSCRRHLSEGAQSRETLPG